MGNHELDVLKIQSLSILVKKLRYFIRFYDLFIMYSVQIFIMKIL
jgi:hypothetical protein